MKDFICNNCEFYSPCMSGVDVEMPSACHAKLTRSEKESYMELNECPMRVKINNQEKKMSLTQKVSAKILYRILKTNSPIDEELEKLLLDKKTMRDILS